VRFVISETPVLGVLVVVATLATVFGTRFDRWESWERLLAGGVVALSVGLLLTPLSFVDGASHVAGGWAVAFTEVVWLTAAYLGLSGAVTRHLGATREWRIRPLEILEPSYGWLPIVALPVAEALALPLLGYAALQPADPGARMLRIAVAGVVAVTIAARTLLTVMDADELTAGVVTDPLTGLYNHRHFQQLLAGEVASAFRFGESVSLIALDVDDFARVNAAGGHAVGDATLVGVARAIDRGVRTRDVVCRLGGDELAVILPGADDEAAFAIGERILAEVRSVSAPGGRWVTASAGVASLRGTAADGAQLLKHAEAALYQAKRLGKDCAVRFFDDGAADLSAEERVRLLHQRADHATVSALAAVVDARDEATQDHSRNVARYAVALGREIGLTESDLGRVEYAALLHDVGKIGIPDALLRKSGTLTAEERIRMEAHAVIGEQILESTTMREILPLVRHHHERWDGSGYPDGLVGDEIPLGARVLALANAYDALRSNRPNRAALSRTAALQELDLGLGSTFDPVLGERFIAAIGRDYL
jgi:diguanylate cyclase (GGDEF)-like protein